MLHTKPSESLPEAYDLPTKPSDSLPEAYDLPTKPSDFFPEAYDLPKNSREKWRKCISVTGSLRGQAQVRPIDQLDEARTNADDQMMLVQHYSGDRVMSYRGFDRIS